jgi:DNA invertase Pin-like site-specific DNA recombinase
MARAKAKGKNISRPKLSKRKQKEIQRLYEQGMSINKIRQEVGVAYGTVWNYVQELK